MNYTNLKILFKLDPEAAFNQDPNKICQLYPEWTIENKFNWWFNKVSTGPSELRKKVKSFVEEMKLYE